MSQWEMVFLEKQGQVRWLLMALVQVRVQTPEQSAWVWNHTHARECADQQVCPPRQGCFLRVPGVDSGGWGGASRSAEPSLWRVSKGGAGVVSTALKEGVKEVWRGRGVRGDNGAGYGGGHSLALRKLSLSFAASQISLPFPHLCAWPRWPPSGRSPLGCAWCL